MNKILERNHKSCYSSQDNVAENETQNQNLRTASSYADYHMYLRAQLMKILLIANDKCYEHGKSITNFKSAFQMKLAERMLRQDDLGGHQYTRYS
ncbi:hypothetical protein ACFX12_043137 [Malus domestica]